MKNGLKTWQIAPLALLLFISAANAQSNKWESIVNFVDVKITLYYIDYLYVNGHLSFGDQEKFETIIRDDLDAIKIDASPKYEVLHNPLIKNKFFQTLKMTNILVDGLKESEQIRSQGSFKWVSFILLGLMYIILFTLVLYLLKRVNNLNNKLLDFKKDDKRKFLEEDSKYKFYNKKFEDLRKIVANNKSAADQHFSELKAILKNSKNSELEWDVPPNPTPFPEVFFAGMPLEENIFNNDNIHHEADPNSSVFQMTILNNDRTEASFEVIQASKYMEKEITNNPDIYLYRVCIYENNNLNFEHNIHTIENGIAEYRDGQWIVVQKARIEFE